MRLLRSLPRVLAASSCGAAVGAAVLVLLWWTDPGPAWAAVVFAGMVAVGVSCVRAGLPLHATALGAWSGTLAAWALLPSTADEGVAPLDDPVVLLVVAATYLGLFAVPVLVGGHLARRLGFARGGTAPPPPDP